MSKRNMQAWADSMIADSVKKPFLVLSFPAVQKLGITVKELTSSVDYQVQAMKLVADLTPKASAALSMMDLSVEAEAFGSEVRFSDDEVPTIVGHIVEDEDGAEALAIPPVGAGRTGVYVEAIRRVKDVITDRPVIAGCIGPFSLAARLMDVSEAMINCYDDPDMVHAVLEKASQFLISYITAFREAGADAVLMAEPVAGLLSPDLEAEFSSPYVKKIIEATQTENFLTCYHNCGGGTVRQIGSISQNGARILHFGNAVDIADIMPHVPSNVIVMGNIDPVSQFRSGTPESVKAAVHRVLEKCSKYPNFVISSGCDIPPMSKWENVFAFYEAVDEFYAGKE